MEPSGAGAASAEQERARALKPWVTVGIVTALPKEFVAAKAMLDGPVEYSAPGKGGGRDYVLGEVPAKGGGTHAVALVRAGMGNNFSAARVTTMMEHFECIDAVLMVGIAGGVPNPKKPADHVRLGDIVVSNQGGVVQYDFDKETVTSIEHRHSPRPPSPRLLDAVEALVAAEHEGHRPWIDYIVRAAHLKGSGRPPEHMDVLTHSSRARTMLEHPTDPNRIPGQSRVFRGPIASANKLLKNPKKRDKLRDLFGVKAVEMEGSGIADATWDREVGYLVVRGICDYCDRNKGDDWQEYASIVAAAYARALLERMRPSAPQPSSRSSSRDTPNRTVHAANRTPRDPSGASPTPAPPGTALHQLRTRPLDFIGRTAEIAELRAELDRGGAIIAGLIGQGGVGKTALALVLAHELRELYPDAQIDIDLRGASTESLTPTQVMAEVILAFEPTAKLPGDQDARGRLYRSILDGKRALILLDNARDRAQVEPLIPPPGCLLLVTSRQHFTLPGIYTRRLGALGLTEAVAFIRSIVPGLDEATAAKLAKVCGYLPLALRVAGRTLAESVTLKPTRYMERLQTSQKRLSEVDAVFSESLALLEPAVRKFWFQLGVFPSDFDKSAAAAVGEVKAEAADDILDCLVRWSLVEYDETKERFRLHDLAREYARVYLDSAERHAAERRHAEHFLVVATKAEDMYVRGGISFESGLVMFDREWTNIETGHAWSIDNANIKPGIDLGIMYPARCQSILQLRLTPAQYAGWISRALQAVEVAPEHRAFEPLLLLNLGTSYLDRSKPRKAAKVFKKVLEIVKWQDSTARMLRGVQQALGQRPTLTSFDSAKVAALHAMGRTYRELGKPVRAKNYLTQALMVARQIGARRGECLVLGSLGLLHARRGKTTLALKLLRQQLTIAIEFNDRKAEAIASWNIGVLLHRRGDMLGAIQMMEVCLIYEATVGHPDLQRHETYVNYLRAKLAEHQAAGLGSPGGDACPT